MVVVEERMKEWKGQSAAGGGEGEVCVCVSVYLHEVG